MVLSYSTCYLFPHIVHHPVKVRFLPSIALLPHRCTDIDNIDRSFFIGHIGCVPVTVSDNEGRLKQKYGDDGAYDLLRRDTQTRYHVMLPSCLRQP